MTKVRAILINSGLPKTLQGEAAIAAIYLYNRISYLSLKDFITSFEARYEEKPNKSNIKTQRSITYKKESNQLLKKLDPRANAYILIRYGSN